MTKVIIHGSKGRMGQMLIACAEHIKGLEVVGEVDEGDDLATAIVDCDAVIDFSFHEVTANAAALCAKHKKALVIGTTGHTDGKRIRSCSTGKTSPSSGPAIIPPASTRFSG